MVASEKDDIKVDPSRTSCMRTSKKQAVASFQLERIIAQIQGSSPVDDHL